MRRGDAVIYGGGAGFGAVLSARVTHKAPMILVLWQNGQYMFLHEGTVMPAEQVFENLVKEKKRG
jgi:hypothetical protein